MARVPGRDAAAACCSAPSRGRTLESVTGSLPAEGSRGPGAVRGPRRARGAPGARPSVRPPGASSASPAAAVCEGDSDARPAPVLAIGPAGSWAKLGSRARRPRGAELPAAGGADGRDADGECLAPDGSGDLSCWRVAQAGHAAPPRPRALHPRELLLLMVFYPSCPPGGGVPSPPFAAVLGRLLTQRGSLDAVSPELPPTGFPHPVRGPSPCLQKLESGCPCAGGGRREAERRRLLLRRELPGAGQSPETPAVSTRPLAGSLTGDPRVHTRSGARTQLSGREAGRETGPSASQRRGQRQPRGAV